jgi:hypothetical protein
LIRTSGRRRSPDGEGGQGSSDTCGSRI